MAGVLWVMALVYEICSIEFTINAWIMGEGGSGTSFDYFIDNQGTGLTVAAAVAAFISTFLADGFLCIRCSALWSKRWVTIPLVLFTLATYAFDFVQMYWVASTNDESLWVIPWNDVFIIPVALAQSLHIIFTVLLVLRFTTVQRESEERIRLKGMAVESALVYGLISVIFLATYCAQGLAANAFLPMLVQIQGIAIDLIIARWESTQHATVAEPAAPTKMLLPAPAHVPSETSSISDKEKLTLTMMTSKWHQELDKKEHASPEYCV
ncbi:hypothetical protein DAEQUDRAFT_674657 [Daedalea quercina L-15889]|uniref:Uncharacterized protein n=1 Tax=Daedalea quercina L-15889 TaxID=1314783 RepID=A0A165N739_9APHY|nr:hypothetical protein DAEQUDRAFT_674657 [Daedalea quercina L-15889]